jgi:hypothetical protein
VNKMTTEGQRQKEQNQDKKGKNYIVTIGFFGGVFASVITYIVHFLNFIPFGPGIILQAWPTYVLSGWMRGPVGHLIGIILLSLLSIVISLLYYGLFRRMNTVWTGLWFGLALWVVIFLGLHQLIPGVRSVWALGWDTNTTLICVFLLYGLFIGYSISYEYHEEEYAREKQDS